MCGIAGVASLETFGLEHVAASMADALTKRGPDDSGTWASRARSIAFGFRRLAILDLTPEGHQPMASASGRYTIVFNGEIYNFRELRKELEALGAKFRGASDTEVILAGVEQWGFEALLPRMNGMFAIGIWDEARQVLYLARDRLGKKPLYYGWTAKQFVFASELKAIAAAKSFQRQLSTDGVRAFFERGYVPAPLSIYQNIFKLLPGSYLKLPLSACGAIPRTFSPLPSDSEIAPRQYWSILEVAKRANVEPFKGTEEQALSQIDEILQDATEKRMIADVPLGAFLSGGIDSSLVVAVMQKLSKSPVKTYCIGFAEKEFDESEHARKVAEHLGVQYNELKVSVAEGLTVVHQLCDIYDEPLADASQIPSLLVSKMAREEVTVALNGDGGDELFGGYNRYLYPEIISERAKRIPGVLRKPLVKGLNRLSRSLGKASAELASSFLPPGKRPSRPGEAYEKLMRVLEIEDPDQIYDYLTRYYPKSICKNGEERLQAFVRPEMLTYEREFLRRSAVLDIGTYLPDDLLAKIDRATMAYSLEGRSPLLDFRLVELAVSIPADLKIKGGEKKYLLKKVLERYLPRELFDRPKVGFSMPIGSWLRGELRDWAEERLQYLENNLSELIDIKQVQEKWQEHLSDTRSHANEIWTAVIFSQWHERWVSGSA